MTEWVWHFLQVWTEAKCLSLIVPSNRAWNSNTILLLARDSMGDKDAGGSVRDQARSKTGSRDITKAVLASPLVIPWSVTLHHCAETVCLYPCVGQTYRGITRWQ